MQKKTSGTTRDDVKLMYKACLLTKNFYLQFSIVQHNGRVVIFLNYKFYNFTNVWYVPINALFTIFLEKNIMGSERQQTSKIFTTLPKSGLI